MSGFGFGFGTPGQAGGGGGGGGGFNVGFGASGGSSGGSALFSAGNTSGSGGSMFAGSTSSLGFGTGTDSGFGGGFGFGSGNTGGTGGGFNLGFGSGSSGASSSGSGGSFNLNFGGQSGSGSGSGFNLGFGSGSGSGGGFNLGFGGSSGGFGGGWGTGAGSAGSMWGTQPAQMAGAAGTGSLLQQERPEVKVAKIYEAYDRGNPNCKFQFVFYNFVAPGDAGKYAKPPLANQQLWDQAVRNNPDPKRLIPCLVVGFEDLKKRIEEQHKAMAAHQSALRDIQNTIAEMENTHEVTVKARITSYRKRQLILSHELLRLMKRIQMMLTKDVPLKNEEIEFRKQLASMKAELAKPTQFQARVTQLASMVRMQDDYASDAGLMVDSDTLGKIYRCLEMQRQELAHLTSVIKRDMDDLDIMVKGLGDVNSKVAYK